MSYDFNTELYLAVRKLEHSTLFDNCFTLANFLLVKVSEQLLHYLKSHREFFYVSVKCTCVCVFFCMHLLINFFNTNMCTYVYTLMYHDCVHEHVYFLCD